MATIYMILNLENNRRYYGGTTGIQTRKNIHKQRLNSGTHYNAQLQKDWANLGQDKFKFKIVKILKKSKMKEMVQFYIDTTEPELCYNVYKPKVVKKPPKPLSALVGKIYAIINIESGKIYYGGTIEITRRKYRHKYMLNLVIHYNKYLQEDWIKFGGQDKFKFRIIEKEIPINLLRERETFHINSTPEELRYNIYKKLKRI